MSVLAIEQIDVGPAVVEARVRVAPGFFSTAACTDLPARAFSLLPGLARHSCRNNDGLDLRRELKQTETAHLLEHVACELMALSGSPRSIRGETRWDFERDGRGVYRVAIVYDDDVAAVGALSAGAEIVEWLMLADAKAPDIDAHVARLRGLRAGATGV